MENNKQVDALEKIVKKQEQQIATLTKRLTLLERENTRRKSEINQLAAAVNKG
jgi:prefoldin subunit 5